MEKERFKPLEQEAMSADQRRVAQALIDGPRHGLPGPFHALLRSPELADRVRNLGDYIRFQNSLPAKVLELVILMLARFWSARYEWYAHRRHAQSAGLDPAIVDAIDKGRRPDSLDAEEALVYDFISELLEYKDVSDPIYHAAVERFGERGVIDMVSTAGYYCFVSLVLNMERHPVPEEAGYTAASEDPVERDRKEGSRQPEGNIQGHVRRVVTGHDDSGDAGVVSDGPAPFVHVTPTIIGRTSTDIWRTLDTPAPIATRAEEPTMGPRRQLPTKRGTVLRINTYPPESESIRYLSQEGSKELFAALGNEQASTFGRGGRHPLMHRTETIDYAIVLEGEIYMVLDRGDVHLKAGDVVVQCGTNHAWSNRSDRQCKVAFVLIDGSFEPALATLLAGNRV